MKDSYDTWLTKNGGFAKDLTVRDHYAGLAFQALIPLWHAEHRAGQLGQTGMEDWDGFYEDFSSQAYDMADEMLAVKQSREAK